MNTGIRLARIAGIDVYLDWSLLIIFALVTVNLGAGVFPAWHPDWSTATAWLTAIGAAVLFLASVLTHELSHALVGRARGIDVPRITLFIFGGMAQMREEPRTWGSELLMAIAGPLTSFAIGIVCLVVVASTGVTLELDVEDPTQIFAPLGPLQTLLMWLGPVNIVLALFNLVPGFPLDGGRVLRAALWGATGDLRRATRWASQAGQLFAWFLIISGVSMLLGLNVPIFGGGAVSGLWLALIGWFLNNAAVQSYRSLVVRDALEGVPVGRLMLANVQTVPPELSLEQLVDDFMMRSDQRAYPVVDGERLLGMVCLQDVRKVPRREWPSRRVGDVMTTKLTTVRPVDAASDALSALARQGVNQLPVVEGGRVRGLVRREDVLRWLSMYGDRDRDEGRAPR